MTTTLTPNPSFPQQEFGATPSQVNGLGNSPQHQQLQKLDTPKIQQLRAIIPGVRAVVAQAVDAAKAKRAGIANRRQQLTLQLQNASNQQQLMTTFFGLAGPTISASDGGSTAGTAVVDANADVYQQYQEISYRLSLLDALDSNLLQDVKNYAAADDFLDQLDVLITLT